MQSSSHQSDVRIVRLTIVQLHPIFTQKTQQSKLVSIATHGSVAGSTQADQRGASTTLPAARKQSPNTITKLKKNGQHHSAISKTPLPSKIQKSSFTTASRSRSPVKRQSQASPPPTSTAKKPKHVSDLKKSSSKNSVNKSYNSGNESDCSTKSNQLSDMSVCSTRSNTQKNASNPSSRSSSTSWNSISLQQSGQPAQKIPPIIILGYDWRKVAGKLMSTAPEGTIQA